MYVSQYAQDFFKSWHNTLCQKIARGTSSHMTVKYILIHPSKSSQAIDMLCSLTNHLSKQAHFVIMSRTAVPHSLFCCLFSFDHNGDWPIYIKWLICIGK